MSSPPQPLPPPVPAPKKTSPIVWILVAVVSIFVLAGIAVIAGGIFFVSKVKQAGNNPALFAAKMIAAANPDVSVVSSDDARGTVTFLDKKTGKTVTVSFDDVKKGKITFEADGQKASIETKGEGKDGAVLVTSPEGSIKFGAGAAKLPDWLPAYPNVTPQGTFGIQGVGEDSGNVTFTVKEPLDKVVSFYEEGLKKSGLTTNSNVLQQNGKATGAMVTAEDQAKKRSAMINLGAGDDGVTVNVTYTTKK
jgi:hypothetical protein